MAAVCKELNRLKVKTEKLTEDLIQHSGLNKCTAVNLSKGIKEAVQLISEKAELEEKEFTTAERNEVTSLHESLRCSALRCSIPANLAADLLTRNICPVCYFGIRNTQSIARPNPRMYQTYDRKVKDGTLTEWIKSLSEGKTLELIVSCHETNCGKRNF